MARIRENLSNWAQGVKSAGRPDKIAPTAAANGENAALVHISSEPLIALPQKRLGCAVQTAVAETGTPQMLGLSWFRRRTGASYTDYSLGISDGGRISKLSSGAWVQADAGTAAPLSSGTLLPSTETMNNLWFVVNGTDQKKFDGTDFTKFGMTQTASSLAAVSGAAGNPNGTYEFKWTCYNENTGHESSSSAPVSVTVSSQKIALSWVAPTDEQATHVRIYARETSTQSTWFRLTSTGMTGTGYEASAGGWTVATLSETYDLTAAQLNALINKAPSTTENDPPSASTCCIAKHASRMFASDGVDLFYSKIDKPEAFDPVNYENVNPDDGQKIVGIMSVSAGVLFIFKEFSTYALLGTDPNSWEIRLISNSVGLVASRGLVSQDGNVYWWSQFGPYKWNQQSGVEPLGFPDISDQFAEDKIANSQLSNVIVDKDVERQRIFFAYPEAGETRNTKMLVFNHRLQVWEGTWNPMDIGALGNLPDSDGAAFLHIGNYKGRLFRIWSGTTDGARLANGGTTFTLDGTVTSATSTTLTDSGATFDTDDAGLDELVVLAIAPDNHVQRRIISSNTGTVLTVSQAWDQTPTSDYTYVIATPDFKWETYHSDRVTGQDGVLFSSPFRRKRFKKIFSSALSSTGNATVSVDVLINTSNFTTTTASVTEITGAVFGTGLFGTAIWGEGEVSAKKSRIGYSGRTIGYIVRNREPNTHVLLLNVGTFATTVSEKL